MPRETTYSAIILKKQAFGEADEIITFYTLERGKIRGLAKSVKLAKSKLQNNLQALFLVRVSLSGRGDLPKIIAAEAQETFFHLRHSLEALKLVFYTVELLLKFTADGHKNQKIFGLYLNVFQAINKYAGKPRLLKNFLPKFQIDFLAALGFLPKLPPKGAKKIIFSNEAGGFSGTSKNSSIDPQLPKLMSFLQLVDYENLHEASFSNKQIQELTEILSNFLRYQLEREIKSEEFLRQ